MSKDLFCLIGSVSPKRSALPGITRTVIVWVKLGGGDEQARIRQQLAQNGWDLVAVGDTKQVSSADHGGDENIRAALTQARENGFAFTVFDNRPN
jgi:hypothetical protein